MPKSQIEKDFEDLLISEYKQWRAGRRDRMGTRYRGMITQLGGVETIKRLLHPRRRKLAYSLSLTDGVERYAVMPKFRHLFNKTEIMEAEDRVARQKLN